MPISQLAKAAGAVTVEAGKEASLPWDLHAHWACHLRKIPGTGKTRTSRKHGGDGAPVFSPKGTATGFFLVH